MSNFLIVGRGFSNLTKKILDRGDNYFLLQDESTAKYLKEKSDKHMVVSFKDTGQLLRNLKKLPCRIDAVITIYESYVLVTAKIAKELGLPGLPIEAAIACTDKYQMRQLFSKYNDISPDFCEVTSEADLVRFAKDHSFPLILKPANLQKSLLVTKSQNLNELLSNYRKTMKVASSVYRRYGQNRKLRFIVEEFMQGSVHSVEAFIDSKGTPHVLEQVVDYQTGYDMGFDDNFHYSRSLPSRLPRKDIVAVREIAKLGCMALGMKNSPAHIEIILTPKGPKIVEIGARNGGYRERMHRLANGLDITDIALDTALGKTIHQKTLKNDSCTVIELFPKTKGVFKGIENEAQLLKLESLTYFAIKQSINSLVGKSANGYKMCAIVILHNKDSGQFRRDLDFVNDKVRVITSLTESSLQLLK